MDHHIYVAIVAAMINLILSLLTPAVISKNSQLPFFSQVRKNYECNRDVIIVSSVLVVIFVYVSLKITPFIEANIFSSLSKLGNTPQLVQ